MHTPNLALVSEPLDPFIELMSEHIGVDEDGNVHLTQRDENGVLVNVHSWAPSTRAGDTVHTLIEWLARGAPGAFADFSL